MGEKIGYIRVSTVEQNTARQEDLMAALGVDRMFIDKCSGSTADRPQLKAMLDYIREGDTIIVESISRLARSTKDFLTLTEKFNDKNVTFISKKENIDTKTPTGQFMMTVFAAMYDLERKNILDRQREGIEAAKKRGKTFGRPKVVVDPDQFDRVCADWKKGNITAVKAINKLHLSKSTFYRLVKTLG